MSAVALVVTVLSVVGGSPLSPFHSAATTGAAAVCQSDGNLGCQATIPCNNSPCPTVDVAPATDLRDGQYAFVQATNFPSTGSMRVALCSSNSSSTDPSCLLGDWEDETWAPVQVPISDDPSGGNLTKVAAPVFLEPDVEGNSPLPAHDITNTLGSVGGFFCGDAADPCEIVVTEEAGQGNEVGFGPPVSPSNSVVVPLSYANQSQGCPASDPTIQTDSSFSLEHFIPAAVDASCGGSGGVIALNTATDNDTVISDFADKGTTLGFVDDPSDIAELSSLAGHAYAFIPIALSGTAVSFLAGDSIGSLSFPVASYKLTPNMVAGLITSAYQYPGGNITLTPKPHLTLADNLVPPLDCTNLVGCPARNKELQLEDEQQFNSFELLNPVAPSVTPPLQYGSFLSNVASGASYQVTDWFCNAPNDPYDVSVNEIVPPTGETNPVTVPVQDPNSAATTFTTAPVGSDIWPPYSPAPPWVFSSCQPYSTLPALSGTEPNFSESQSPALQAKAMRQWSYGGGPLPQPPNPQTPLAGFGVMDSSEASFYGLDDAALQNAAGNFVAPTTTSLEDGADDLTPCPTDVLSCPAGTYAMNYDSTSLSTDAGAYPMPDITYAVVSTAPQPAATASAEQDLLDNLVKFSHNDASQLPAGYAPLPTSLYNVALTDISNALVSEPSNSTGPGGTTPKPESSSGSGPAGSSTTSATGGFEGSAGSLGDDGLGSSGSGSELPSTSAGGKNNGREPGASAQVVSSTIPVGSIQLALDDAARFLLPILLAIAAGCLLVGPLLYFWPALRRRRR